MRDSKIAHEKWRHFDRGKRVLFQRDNLDIDIFKQKTERWSIK